MSGNNPLPAGVAAILPALDGGMLLGHGLGGVSGASANARPLGQPPQFMLRQPDLKQAPAVSAITGFGTGAGAGVANNGQDADQSQGVVRIVVGRTPAASGTVVVNFPATIPAGGMLFLTDFANLSPSIVGGVATIGWTATRTLIPGEVLLLTYQWAISR